MFASKLHWLELFHQCCDGVRWLARGDWKTIQWMFVNGYANGAKAASPWLNTLKHFAELTGMRQLEECLRRPAKRVQSTTKRHIEEGTANVHDSVHDQAKRIKPNP